MGGNAVHMPGVSLRNEQQRDPVRIRRSDAGKGVFGAGSVLHSENGRRMAVGYPGVAVGDANPDPFLTAYDRTQADFGCRLDQRSRGEAEQVFCSLPLDYARDDVNGSNPGFASG